LIKTQKGLVRTVLLFIIVPLAAIFLIVKLIGGGLNVDPDSPAMSEDAIAERLKPVGQVSVLSAAGEDSTPEAPASDQTAGAAESTPQATIAGKGEPSGAPAAANAGEQVYNTSCQVCHGPGIAGAPKVGDKAVWEARIAQGIDALYANAINGKGTMPPKGGAMSTSDDDIRAAVDIMVSKSR
jgi:cytochrome c5